MNIKDALDFIKTTPLKDYLFVEDLRECLWSIDDAECELLWHVEGVPFYAEDIGATRIQIDDLIFINADDICGDTITYIFDINKQQPVGVLND